LPTDQTHHSAVETGIGAGNTKR